MISFAWGEDSNVGRVRQVNQDRALATSRLAAVADGMGGHLGGEVAAEVAIRTLEQQFTARTLDALVEGVVSANTKIHEQSQQDENLHGMGTTVCAIAPLDDDDAGPQIALVNVGDSRVYRLESTGLVQLTEDHSLVAEMVRGGRLSAEDAVGHPQRNILTRALGTDTQVEVDCWAYPAAIGERYLLCSDGLFNEVSNGIIAETLSATTDPNEAARKLVSMANAAGGRDNVTCVIVDIVDVEGAGALPTKTADTAGSGRRVIDTQDIAAPPSEADPPPLDQPAQQSRSDQAPLLIEPETPTRRFTWRVGLFCLAIIAVLVVAALAVSMFRDASYFADADSSGEQVVIYQGRRDGFLWFAPSIVEETGVRVENLTPADFDSIKTSSEVATLKEAQDVVQRAEQSAQTKLKQTERPSTTISAGASDMGRPTRDSSTTEDPDAN